MSGFVHVKVSGCADLSQSIPSAGLRHEVCVWVLLCKRRILVYVYLKEDAVLSAHSFTLGYVTVTWRTPLSRAIYTYVI